MIRLDEDALWTIIVLGVIGIFGCIICCIAKIFWKHNKNTIKESSLRKPKRNRRDNDEDNNHINDDEEIHHIAMTGDHESSPSISHEFREKTIPNINIMKKPKFNHRSEPPPRRYQRSG